MGLGYPSPLPLPHTPIQVLGEAFAGETLKGKQYTPPFSYFEAEQRPKVRVRVRVKAPLGRCSASGA